ncbi:unnamed protein product [Urochloa decumbens]|uniref:Uncharacterized protein n=1 Tax=Urochloa decumbens TaxID=240449 RepID=A0ABC9E1J1_9POAL
MAEHRGAARNHQPAIDAAFANPDNGDDRAQRLCLDAGRALAVCGLLVATGRPAFKLGPADDTTLIIACFIGFVLILGACLCILALTPVAPRAARAAAAAASTVLRCLSPLMN